MDCLYICAVGMSELLLYIIEEVPKHDASQIEEIYAIHGMQCAAAACIDQIVGPC